jgi:hypothetical protein
MSFHMCEYVLVISDVPHIFQRVDDKHQLVHDHIHQLNHLHDQNT